MQTEDHSTYDTHDQNKDKSDKTQLELEMEDSRSTSLWSTYKPVKILTIGSSSVYASLACQLPNCSGFQQVSKTVLSLGDNRDNV
ncbi:hypothetical protein BaRGS_00029488 [Batillaria attramentaria]|uniref:Uncharacterized protein n=1 Tax=Batillaria attramentaria TaxID=370345 RepID=A0ABD0JVZ0_9CAEN